MTLSYLRMKVTELYNFIWYALANLVALRLARGCRQIRSPREICRLPPQNTSRDKVCRLSSLNPFSAPDNTLTVVIKTAKQQKSSAGPSSTVLQFVNGLKTTWH